MSDSSTVNSDGLFQSDCAPEKAQQKSSLLAQICDTHTLRRLTLLESQQQSRLTPIPLEVRKRQGRRKQKEVSCRVQLLIINGHI